jgi:hypothetical protein
MSYNELILFYSYLWEADLNPVHLLGYSASLFSSQYSSTKKQPIETCFYYPQLSILYQLSNVFTAKHDLLIDPISYN